MPFPADFDLDAEIVGCITLVALDTTAGILRLGSGFEGTFVDCNGHSWLGSRLISTSSTEFSINGNAPALTLTFAWVQDPDTEDLLTIIRNEGGIAAIKGRPAIFYFQYLTKQAEIFAPVHQPVQWFKREMINLVYTLDGPQQRTVSVVCEGDWRLRNRPLSGRYTVIDHARRLGVASNPSLEFMPTHVVDNQPLFGL